MDATREHTPGSTGAGSFPIHGPRRVLGPLGLGEWFGAELDVPSECPGVAIERVKGGVGVTAVLEPADRRARLVRCPCDVVEAQPLLGPLVPEGLDQGFQLGRMLVE